MTWAPIAGVSVVGVTGQARHGKDEFARAALQVVPGAERFALSDAVAVVARAMAGMTTRDAGVLQQVGTACREGIDAEVWLRCLYGAIADRRPALAIVTGVRYANEAAAIRAMGGRLVAVVRPGAPPVTDRDPAHPVEAGIADLVAAADVTITVPELAPEALAVFHAAKARAVLA